MVRKHLGWTKDEFQALDPDHQRIYREGLIYYLTGGKGAGEPEFTHKQPPPGIQTRTVKQDLSHLPPQ